MFQGGLLFWVGSHRVLESIVLEQELANYSPWAESGPLLIFINKVLLKQNQTNLFTCFQ